MKKTIIIINPHSGRKHKKIDLVEIEKLFNKYEYDVKILFTNYRGHAKEIVKNLEQVDLVVSVGGDGTFNEVMTGNFNRKERLLLAHIPLGTANDIGTMYGYSKSLLKNFKLLLKGSIQKIDICTINDKPFTYVAAFGKFTNISYETPRWLKKRFGYLAYLIEGLKEIGGKTKLYHLKYEVDGKTYEGNYSFILISNANRIAGINNFYNNIKLNDNAFEVLFCTINHRKDIIKNLYSLTKTDISNAPGFSFYKTNNLKIKFDKTLDKAFSVDGEELEDKNRNFEIKIVRDVEILIPNKNVSKLFLDKE